MTKVSMSTDLPASPEAVWELVGSFGALSNWHPAVEKTELESGGKRRRLSLVGGGSIVEELERTSDTEHVYRYSILESPLPVAGYVAEVRVREGPGGKGCTVEWSSDFKPKDVGEADARKVIEGIYQAGLDNLRKLFGG